MTTSSARDPQAILSSLLDAARKAGADAADALFVEGVSSSVSYRLGKLEDVERATKRILTHAEFGLGPPSGTLGLRPKPGGGLGLHPKPGGGLGLRPKPGGGLGLHPKPGGGLGLHPKPGGGLGLHPKPGGGLGDEFLTFAVDSRDDDSLDSIGSGSRNDEVILAQLFTQVGSAMSSLEESAANIENTTAAILTDPMFAARLAQDDARAAAVDMIERTFRELEELSKLARRTVQRVLSHPVFGLGPGNQDMGRSDRDEFARFGGLSGLNLRLL